MYSLHGWTLELHAPIQSTLYIKNKQKTGQIVTADGTVGATKAQTLALPSKNQDIPINITTIKPWGNRLQISF